MVKQALEITPIDFAVIDGLRTFEEQRRYVATGSSQTPNSRRLTGHVADLAAFIGNKARWELDLLCKVSEAMRAATIEVAVPLRWGGHWEVLLTEESAPTEGLAQDYIQRCVSAGRKPLVDAPHFELPRNLFP